MEKKQLADKSGGKEERYLVFSILLAFSIILLANLNKLNGITIIGDEYGYWAAGAFFAGKDWSDVTSLNPYYAYGYGFILAVLIKLVGDMIIAYKIAIILNVILLCCSFLIMIQVGSMLFPKESNKLIIVVSGCITLYSNTIFQSQTTQVEVLLYFLFCLLSYVLLKYLNEKKLFYGIFACFIVVYMFTVHMRCVSIIIAFCLTLLFLFIRKDIKLLHVCIFLFTIAVLFGGSLLVKTVVKKEAYTKKESAIQNHDVENEKEKVTKSANDFSGQIDKIKSLFSVKGFIDFCVSFTGKIYYLCAATFFLFLWSVFYLLRHVKMILKKEKIYKTEDVYAGFLLLSVIFTVAVSALFMIEITRQDTLIYGRYSEYICGPLLLIGLLEFFYNQQDRKKSWIIIGIFFFLSCVVYSVLSATKIESLYDNNVVGIVYWIIKAFGDVGKENFVFLVSLETVLFYFILICMNRIIKNKKVRYLIIMGLCSCLWIICADEVFKHNTEKQQKRVRTSYNLLQVIENTEKIYLADSAVEYLYVDYLQFFSPDTTIRLIDLDDISSVEQGAYIFLYKDIAPGILNEALTYKGKSEHFILYQKK